MRICHLENPGNQKVLKVRSALLPSEYKQLDGELDKLCVFSTSILSTRTSFIKTGAKHNYAKYLLFPVQLRHRFQVPEYDFESMSCGTIEHDGNLYIIYSVPQRLGVIPSDKEDSRSTEELTG